MRLGEILGLRWMDVDFNNNQIGINQTLVQTKKELILQPTAKSDNSRRTLDVPPEVIAVLDKHRRFQRLLRKGREDEPEIDRKELVFQTKNKTPIRPRNMERSFDNQVRKLNRQLQEEKKEPVEEINFHGMRHTFAVIQLQENLVPLETVSEMLGHADIRTTLESYAHVIPKNKKEAAQKMDSLIPKNK